MMKNTIKTIISLLLVATTVSAGNLKNSDFATPAQITGAGGSLSQLLNEDKVWSVVLTEQISTGLANGDIANKTAPFVMGQQVTPPAPAAGFDKCYVKADNKFYCENSAAAETLIGPSAAPVGAANTFAGYDPAGNLNPIPGWAINTANSNHGASVNQTITVPFAPSLTKVHDFESEINPTVTSTGSSAYNFAVDMHYDRTGTGNNFNGNIADLTVDASHEGAGHVDSMDAANITLDLIGSGSTNQAHAVSINGSVRNGHTLGQYTGVNNFLQVNPTATATDATMYNANFSGDAGQDLALYNGFSNGNVTRNANGMIVGINSHVGGTKYIISGGSGGPGQEYLTMMSLNNGAPTTHNVRFMEANNGGGGVRQENFDGLFINNQAPSAQNTTLVNAVDSGGSQFFTGLNLNLNAPVTVDAVGMRYTTTSAVTGTTTGADFNMLGDATNSVGVQVSPNGNYSNSAVGFRANMGAANVTGGTKRAISYNSTGGLLQLISNFTPLSNLFVDSGNLMITGVNITGGSPLVGSDVLVNNGSVLLDAQDNISLGPIGLGMIGQGYVANWSVANSKIVDSWSNVISGGTSSAGSTGGTINNIVLYDALGIANFGGGPLNYGNEYGLRIKSGYNALITGTAWGISDQEPSSIESFAGTLVEGAVDGTPTNASVGIEIKSTTKALLQSRMTTAQRLALTAVNGMQVYDTSLDVFECYEGGAWNDCAAGAGFVTAVTASAPIFSSGGGTPNITLAANTTAGTYNLVTVDAFGLVQAGGNAIDQGITQITGDATAGPGNGSQPITFATVNANVGTFNNVTVNAKGLVTGAFATPSGSGTVTNVTAVDPIFVTSGSTTPNITLAASGVVAGTYPNATVTVDAFGRITGSSIGFPEGQVLIAATDIDWSLGNLFYQTLSANTTFTMSNLRPGQTLSVRLTNTAGNFTVTWPAFVVWSGGTPPVQTIGVKSDVYTFVYDAILGEVFGSVVPNF